MTKSSNDYRKTKSSGKIKRCSNEIQLVPSEEFIYENQLNHYRVLRNKKQNNINSGKWNWKEHKLFVIGIILHGNAWDDIQKLIKTRSIPQTLSHSQKFFIKIRKMKLLDYDIYSAKKMRDHFRHKKMSEKKEIIDKLTNSYFKNYELELTNKYYNETFSENYFNIFDGNSNFNKNDKSMESIENDDFLEQLLVNYEKIQDIPNMNNSSEEEKKIYSEINNTKNETARLEHIRKYISFCNGGGIFLPKGQKENIEDISFYKYRHKFSYDSTNYFEISKLKNDLIQINPNNNFYQNINISKKVYSRDLSTLDYENFLLTNQESYTINKNFSNSESQNFIIPPLKISYSSEKNFILVNDNKYQYSKSDLDYRNSIFSIYNFSMYDDVKDINCDYIKSNVNKENYEENKEFLNLNKYPIKFSDETLSVYSL